MCLFRFLQCLHPYLPILAKRDPDECYDASPILFWVILYITCRRYTKDRVFFQALVDHVEKDIWKAVSATITTLETVHAVLFLCAWPLPNLRLLIDPSTNLVSLITSGAMLLGVQTGRGSSKEFCVGGRRECIFSDEEAASTWFACFCFHFETGVKNPSFSNINFRCVGSSLFYVEEKLHEQVH